ncbi:aminotransferase class V-fold PLP-dependent enzyme [Marinomonas epiphytica]
MQNSSSTFRHFNALDHHTAYELDKQIQKICDDYVSNTNIYPTQAKELSPTMPFEPVPDTGSTPKATLAQLESEVVRNTINLNSPHFIGHMASTLPNFVAPVAKLVATLNQNLVKVETSGAITSLEKHCISMIHQMFFNRSNFFYEQHKQSHESPIGIMTSGGTLANTMALQCARNNSLAQFGNVEEEGVHSVMQKSGHKRSVIICSEFAHYSVKKALGALGLGRDSLFLIKANASQQIDVHALAEAVETCKANNWHVIAILAVAGTTECGSFDDINTMADIAQQHKIHFHVDAAWGGAFVFSKHHAGLMKGIEKADSITIDAHKQLYTPVGLGILLFKESSATASLKTTANYIIREGSNDLGRYNIEGSRPAMALHLYVVLQVLGKKGIAEILDKNITTCADLADYIESQPNFELVIRPQSNILLYRLLHPTDQDADLNALNVQIHQQQLALGKHFVSRTTINTPERDNLVCLRVVIADPTTNLDHCIAVLEEQKALLQEVAQS